MSKVSLIGNIVIPNADLAAVTEDLPTHIELTKLEDGCLAFQVTQHPDNSNRYDV
ncbi:MAG: autoinducer 2-degrading protein [Planctomycetota bacterium]|jgi:autoinducer 2-degrading protein